MTDSYAFSDQATQTVVDILGSDSDHDDAHLPPAISAAPAPDVPAVAVPATGGYQNTPSDIYMTNPRGASSAAPRPQPQAQPHPIPAPSPRNVTAPVLPSGPYVFPAKQPKPGEFRVLKELQPHLATEHEIAKKELDKRDVFGRPKTVGDKIVRYLNDKKREKYRVDIGTMITRDSRPFDTGGVKAKYMGTGIGSFQMIYATPDQQQEWNALGLIWVCVGDPKGTERPAFFSHVGKPGRFHHSSFNRGQHVIAAGEWIIKDGALLKVSATSGHYAPTIDFLYHAMLQLAVAFRNPDTGIGTTVFLFDRETFKWVDRPVKEFIKSPTAGGRYTTHPSATI